jgi:flagellar M-ring protein FliF
MNQISKLIAGLSLKQKISIVLAAMLVCAAVIALVHFKHEGDFHPLYTSMAPEDAATVVQKLKETGVEYRLADNGASVLVSSGKLAESRLTLAAAGLPKSGRIGFELFDKNNFGATEFVEHINYQRALEGELERSVMSLAEVEQARVHLTLPKESVFLDQQQPAKASVMVKLKPGEEMSPQNVLAVTNLVASAVQGLAPEAVSVVDMNGTLLSRPKKAASGDGAEISGESLEVRQQLEHTLIAKISQTLEPLLGANGFRAGASVDCDFTSGEQQEEILDPTHSVMLSSQKTEDVTDHANSAGIPGTASNLPPATPAAPAPVKTGGGVSRRTENITYQASRVVKHTRIPQGVIRRMSLAVLVDQGVRWEGDGAQKHRVLVPPPPETLKTIKDLVAAVTGLNAERGDQLIVETLPFESSLNAQPPSTAKPGTAPKTSKDPLWLQLVTKNRDLALPISIALAMIVFLIRGLFRPAAKRRPAVSEVSLPEEVTTNASAPQLEGGAAPAIHHPNYLENALAAANEASDERGQIAEHVRQLAKRDPVSTANILLTWMREPRS